MLVCCYTCKGMWLNDVNRVITEGQRGNTEIIESERFNLSDVVSLKFYVTQVMQVRKSIGRHVLYCRKSDIDTLNLRGIRECTRRDGSESGGQNLKLTGCFREGGRKWRQSFADDVGFTSVIIFRTSADLGTNLWGVHRSCMEQENQKVRYRCHWKLIIQWNG